MTFHPEKLFKSFGLIVFILILTSLQSEAAGLKRIAVFSSFREELVAIKKQLVPPGTHLTSTIVNGTEFDEVDLNGCHYVFFLSGMSMVNAAMNAQLAIDRFHVDALVFSGIAGGINPKLHPGDVIVPAEWIHQMESVWPNPDPKQPKGYLLPVWFKSNHGNYGMMFANDVEVMRDGLKQPEQKHAFPADPILLAAAQKAAESIKIRGNGRDKAQVVVGTRGMSGPVFLDNREYREFAYKNWQVDGHDMESTAIAQVGWVNRVPVLIIRGLSDLAGGQAGINEEEQYLELAAANAAAVTTAMLRQLSAAPSSEITAR